MSLRQSLRLVMVGLILTGLACSLQSPLGLGQKPTRKPTRVVLPTFTATPPLVVSIPPTPVAAPPTDTPLPAEAAPAAPPTDTPAPPPPTDTPAPPPTEAPAAPPPTQPPAPTAPPPPSQPVAGAHGVIGEITFRDGKNTYAVGEKVFVKIKVTNTKAGMIPFGVLGLKPSAGAFQTSWSNGTIEAGKPFTHEDGLPFSAPGAYKLWLSICFSPQDACGSGDWERFEPGLDVIVQ